MFLINGFLSTLPIHATLTASAPVSIDFLTRARYILGYVGSHDTLSLHFVRVLVFLIWMPVVIFFTNSFCANAHENSGSRAYKHHSLAHPFCPSSLTSHRTRTSLYCTLFRVPMWVTGHSLFEVALTNALRRQEDLTVDPSTLISCQMKQLSDAIEDTKHQMAKTKQAMRLVERSLSESYQMIKCFNTVRLSAARLLPLCWIAFSARFTHPSHSCDPTSEVSLLICLYPLTDSFIYSLFASTPVDPPPLTIACHRPPSPAAGTSSNVFVECPKSYPIPSAHLLSPSLHPPTLSSFKFYQPHSPFVPLSVELLAFMDLISVPSSFECLQHFDDFLLYAATECSSSLFHRRPCTNVDHCNVVSCSPLRLDHTAYEHFITLLRCAKLPICQDCFIPVHQHHSETHPRCVYPSNVANLAFLIWNHPSILCLIAHVLHRILPCEEIEGILHLERYVQFLGNIVDEKPLLLFFIGVYWFLYETDGVSPT